MKGLGLELDHKMKEMVTWIRKRGKISKQELQQRIGLPMSTLTRLLDELVGKRFIHEYGYGESTGGRRPILYELNPTYGYVIGFDISRTTSRIVFCDLHFRKLGSKIWSMTESMTPQRLITEAVEAVHEWMAASHITAKQILGMGVGAVGPLDRSAGLILEPLYFPASGWRHLPICSILEQELNIPVFLDNGANTVLLSEYWLDSTQRFEHLLYVHAGVGIRSAMMTSGSIVYGAVDMEGAVGQMIIQADGISPRHDGGNYGSWEAYCTVSALEQAAQSMLKKGRISILESWIEHPSEVTYAHLERALQHDDPAVKELFAQAALYFGIGLANMLNILHPQKVILGGPLFASSPLFFEQATAAAMKKTCHYPAYQVEFSPSALAEDSVAVGAAVLAFNRLLD